MKRSIAFVLAAMMMMTLLLSGCGDTNNSSQAVSNAVSGDEIGRASCRERVCDLV